MKEIIEKYNSKTLTIYEFKKSNLGLVIGDVIKSTCGEVINIKTDDDCSSAWHHTMIIERSARLDLKSYEYSSKIKAITGSLVGAKKMEKQPTEYGYVKVEYSHAWEVVKLMEEGVELFKTDSDELQIKRINSIALRGQCGYDFYRRIPITAEQLHERKVEELKDVINNAMSRCQYRRDEPLAAAKSALEWIKQEG